MDNFENLIILAVEKFPIVEFGQYMTERWQNKRSMLARKFPFSAFVFVEVNLQMYIYENILAYQQWIFKNSGGKSFQQVVAKVVPVTQW